MLRCILISVSTYTVRTACFLSGVDVTFLFMSFVVLSTDNDFVVDDDDDDDDDDDIINDDSLYCTDRDLHMLSIVFDCLNNDDNDDVDGLK